ncbi:unnamed protein product [Spirodela intermedia]|uniref:Gnk2-homologous domain-containing protein n=1 Tax=Spirodela intermedia TaxID=51605 RepID=A0A7I8K6B3_SPIIN|nr:unnamed protein product [Spirodela intermedia]
MGSFHQSWRQLLLLSSLFLLHSLTAYPAVSGIFYTLCRNPGTYTANGTFEANLSHLISSLSASAPVTGFANDTVGLGPDQVFGLAQCREDLTEEQCGVCLVAGVEEVTRLCPYKKAAVMWNETCHLRYSNQRFFGKLRGEKLIRWITGNVTSDPNFDRILLGLLDGLTARAAVSPRMFATGKTKVDVYDLYGLVQCTRDLALDVCGQCLKTAIGDVQRYCEGKQGAWVIEGSCDVRYGVFPILQRLRRRRPLNPMQEDDRRRIKDPS